MIILVVYRRNNIFFDVLLKSLPRGVKCVSISGLDHFAKSQGAPVTT